MCVREKKIKIHFLQDSSFRFCIPIHRYKNNFQMEFIRKKSINIVIIINFFPYFFTFETFSLIKNE